MDFGSKDYELVSAGTRLCYATGRRNREKGASMKVVIVGGVAGGATAAARLRRLDESAEIVVFERSGYISYANCGLPYYIGGTIADKSALTLQTPESFRARFNVDMRTRHEVEAVDANCKIFPSVRYGSRKLKWQKARSKTWNYLKSNAIFLL